MNTIIILFECDIVRVNAKFHIEYRNDYVFLTLCAGKIAQKRRRTLIEKLNIRDFCISVWMRKKIRRGIPVHARWRNFVLFPGAQDHIYWVVFLFSCLWTALRPNYRHKGSCCSLLVTIRTNTEFINLRDSKRVKQQKCCFIECLWFFFYFFLAVRIQHLN